MLVQLYLSVIDDWRGLLIVVEFHHFLWIKKRRQRREQEQFER